MSYTEHIEREIPQKIKSNPPNDAYRDGWDRVFGREKSGGDPMTRSEDEKEEPRPVVVVNRCPGCKETYADCMCVMPGDW